MAFEMHRIRIVLVPTVLSLAILIPLQGCEDDQRETMAVFTGTVVDSITLAPLPGAEMFVGDTTNNPNDITDSAGHFDVAIYGSKITLTASHEGYFSKTKSVDSRSQSANINFELAPQ